MNSLFPLVYSTALFCFLALISFLLIKQIINTQSLEKKMFELKRTIKKDNYLYESYYKLGQLYFRKKFFSKAILLFREAIRNWDLNDNIGLGSLYNTIGFTYFTLKEYKLAVYSYKIAIRILPDYANALVNLGYAYEKQNLLLKSYNFYNEALLHDVHNSLALKRIIIVKRLLAI